MLARFAPVTPEVVDGILPRLRAIDRLELDCMRTGAARDDLIRVSTHSRRAAAAYMGDDLVCIFGVKAVTALSDVGCPWALVTRAVDRPDVRRAFAAGSAPVVEWMGQDFRRLWNLVAEENRTARRWLEWLGFHFDGRAIDLRGHRFLHFEKEMR